MASFPLASHIILSPPHFFTVILKLNLQHQKLMIPEKFVKEYGTFLSSSVSLKLPDGNKWDVGLTTDANGAVWLQNGWHKFAEYYSLEFGSFLVFRFDGNSTFHTMIFDVNGSEIEYSSSNFDENLDELKNRENGSFSSLQSFQKMRNQDSFPPKVEPQVDIVHTYFSQPRQPLAPKTENFSSESEKPCFKVVMRQSNVEGRFEMIIPKEFAGKYLSEEFGMIRLQISNGKTWSLVYKWNRIHQGNDFAYFSSGWKRFAEENHLKQGDIGLFQYMKKDQFLFTKLQYSSPPSPKNKTTTPTIRPYPFFQVDNLLKNYRDACLHIPTEFAKEHLSPEMDTARLLVGKKQWKVKLKWYGKRVRFSAGWPAFYKENCLKETSCSYEMINRKMCLFKVTIFNIISSTSSSGESED